MDLSQKKINDEFAVVAAIVLSSNEFQQPHDYSEKNVDHCKKILPLNLANEPMSLILSYLKASAQVLFYSFCENISAAGICK